MQQPVTNTNSPDQAAGLRRMLATPAMSLMAFPVGEGDGAGWIARLSRALCGIGLRPVVVDATRGGLVARALNLKPRHELIDMLLGDCDFETAALRSPGGAWVLRAERGVEAFVASGAPAQQLFSGFMKLSHGFDTLLLAMPPDELASMASPARAVPVVALDDGVQGLVRAYGVVKQLAAGFGYSRFAVVDCAACAPEAARPAARGQGLVDTARSFLNVEVSLAGSLAGAGLAELASSLHYGAATPIHNIPSYA